MHQINDGIQESLEPVSYAALWKNTCLKSTITILQKRQWTLSYFFIVGFEHVLVHKVPVWQKYKQSEK